MAWLGWLGVMGLQGCAMDAVSSPASGCDDAAGEACEQSTKRDADLPSSSEGCEQHALEAACWHDGACGWREENCVAEDNGTYHGVIGGIYQGKLDGEEAWLIVAQLESRLVGALQVDERGLHARFSGALRDDGRLALAIDRGAGHDQDAWVLGQVNTRGDILLGASELTIMDPDLDFESARFSVHEGFRPVGPDWLRPSVDGTYLGGAHAFGDIGDLPDVNYVCSLDFVGGDVVDLECQRRTAHAPAIVSEWSHVIPDSVVYDAEEGTLGFLVEAGEKDVPVVGRVHDDPYGPMGRRIDALILRAGADVDAAQRAIDAIPYVDVVGSMSLTPNQGAPR